MVEETLLYFAFYFSLFFLSPYSVPPSTRLFHQSFWMAFIRATSPHRELLRDCSNVTERSLNEGEKMSFLLKHDELVAQKSSSSPSFIFLVFAPLFFYDSLFRNFSPWDLVTQFLRYLALLSIVRISWISVVYNCAKRDYMVNFWCSDWWN